MKNFLKVTFSVIVLAILIIIVRGKNEEENAKIEAERAKAKTEAGKRGLTEATVLYTFDGDTIQVSIDGEEKSLRFVGVDTPESVNPDKEKNTPEGKVASEFTKGYLTKGMKVYLEFDEVTQDKYERMLAYVWLSAEIDMESYEDFCKNNYGAILLQETYCRAEYIPPNGKYYEWYKQLEEENQGKMAKKTSQS